MGLSPSELAEALRPVLDGVYRLVDPKTKHDHSEVFHQPVPRALHDYYRVIKRPMALSQMRANLAKHKYTTAHEFFADLAQIAHNAYTYNPPDHFIHKDAQVIERYAREQLQVLRQTGLFDPADLVYPDLGPIPDLPPLDMSPMEDTPGFSSDDDMGGRRRRRPVRKAVMFGRRKLRGEEEEEEVATASEGRKKRGRPPTVDKPHEHRIKAIMRAVRREKDPLDPERLLCTDFEKMPSSEEYLAKIPQPIAIDTVRKNIKRRGYSNVEAFLADMSRVFNNAKEFIEDESSQMYQDAVALQHVMAVTAEEELKKPDSAYADPESSSKTSRLPLDYIDHRGEQYRVGDWVHISNPNDPAKPTVGQVFRMWQENGQQWVNCCWYYRPEQTVHKYDKLFYDNEVVKSGQYRDHLIDDMLEKCFVMFITKYQRGRPKGIGSRSVYCCENRYNENEKTFNKIRTWKACIPDEIRTTDYPMDLFDKMRPLKRLVSPLKHLLPADARDDDDIPEPVKGAPNAPPIRGAVYKRPIDPNDPPEQPTPPSPPPSNNGASARSQSPALQANGSMNGDSQPQQRQGSLPAIPQPNMGNRGQSFGSNAAGGPSGGMQFGFGTPGGPGFGGRQSSGAFGGGPGYGPPEAFLPNPNGPPMPPPMAFVMPDQIQTRLPSHQTKNVSQMPDGKLVWFAACPVWVSHRIERDPLPRHLKFDVEGEAHRGQKPVVGFGHSARYLAWKRQRVQ